MEALTFDLLYRAPREAGAKRSGGPREAAPFVLQAQARLTQPTAILGPSGAGKSTLLALLAGLKRPTRGRVALGEQVLVDTERGRWVPPWRRRLGVVFQDTRLWPHQRVGEQIRFGGRHREEAVVELCDLGGLLARRPTSLSGGERRRAAIARALMTQPRALLLDEPMAGLDGARRDGVRQLIARLATSLDLPVVVVTHELSEALTIAPQVLLLRAGEVVGGGPAPLGDLTQHADGFDVAQTLGLESLLRVRVEEPLREATGVVRATLASARGDQPGDAPVLTLPPCELPRGAWAWLGVRPEDVLLSAGPVEGLSARNQLAGVVARCSEVRGRVLVDVELAVGQRLQAELTQASRDALGLCPGRPVWAHVKTWAFRWRGRAEGEPRQETD